MSLWIRRQDDHGRSSDSADRSGAGDGLAGGLAGTPTSKTRAVLGFGAATLAFLAVEATTRLAAPTLSDLLLVVPPLLLWYVSRAPTTAGRNARFPLTLLPIASLLLLIAPFPLLDLSLASPAHASQASNIGRGFALFAVLVFQGPTANAIVREVLRLANVALDRNKPKLRGGRFIGLFERWLILGLATFDLTAAALVVSAKSLLRFPELSSAARTDAGGSADVSELTEYFLLGSLVSWTLALASVAVLRISF